MLENRRLAKVLSLFDVSVLASASMGPAYSLAATMGPMIAAAGSAAIVALLALAVCMACIALAYSRLSYYYPDAGSSYAWMFRAFGPHAGAMAAWILMMANIFAVLATAIPAGTYTLALLAPHLAQSPQAVACVGGLWVVVSGLLLAAGLRPTAEVTTVLLLGELVVLAASAIVCYLHPVVAPTAAMVAAGPVPSFSWIGISSAMVLAIWMVDGWELSAATSEESRQDHGPGRGGLIAMISVSVIVLVCMLAYMHFLPISLFVSHQADAMALVASQLGGWWIPVIVGTVLLSTSASLWTTILYLTRSFYAMGRDNVIPGWFAGLSEGGTPRRALMLATIPTTALTLLSGSSSNVKDALTLALSGSGVFLGLLFIGAACASVAMLRKTTTLFWGTVVPLFGAISIALISVVQVAQGDSGLRYFALAAIVLGIPFSFWRGARMRLMPTAEREGPPRP